jgi:protein phosphatase 1 regulatory subunit 10
MHIDLSFEETIDWYEPSGSDCHSFIRVAAHISAEMGIPPEMDYPRGGLSTEKVTQAQREQSTVGAFYMSAAQIPDTPTEPAGPLLTDAEQDQEVKIMEVGEEHAALFGNGQFMEVDMPPQRSVAELLGQLAPGGVNGGPVTNGIGVPPTAAGVGGMSFQSLGFDPNMLQMMHNMPPEQLQQMLSNPQENMNMNPFTPGQGAQPPPHYGQSSYGGGGAGEQPWMGPPYGQSGGGREDWEDRNSWDGGGQGGFRGAGRGRGQGRGGGGSRQHTKRIPCSFFAQGRYVTCIRMWLARCSCL